VVSSSDTDTVLRGQAPQVGAGGQRAAHHGVGALARGHGQGVEGLRRDHLQPERLQAAASIAV
jgi:hypothetical protein